jgi:hypothetical protein
VLVDRLIQLVTQEVMGRKVGPRKETRSVQESHMDTHETQPQDLTEERELPTKKGALC